MTKDEALRMAIQAMIYHIEQTRSITSTCIAINACKEALAQPTIWSNQTVQKLVAWTITSPDGITVDEVPDYAFYSESDAIDHRDEQCFMECNVVPLYTHPVVKDSLTVQPLSDEEINAMWYKSNNDVLGVSLGYTTQQHYFARAIEKRILARYIV